MVDSQELDNVGMPESTQYRAFFLEATSGVSYSLLVERLVELLGRAREALVLDGVNGSVGASSQFISSLSYSLECVLLQSCCLIRFSSSLRHIFLAHNKTKFTQRARQIESRELVLSRRVGVQTTIIFAALIRT